MEDFKKLLEDANDGKRKQSSLDQIRNNIKRLYNRCYGQDPDDISQIEGMIEDYQHTFECLQSDWDGKKLGFSTMLSYTNAILITNDLMGLDFKIIYGNLERELQVRREDDKRKNPVKTNKISREDLDKILLDIKSQETTYKCGLRTYALWQILAKYPFRLETATLERISETDWNELDETNNLGVRNFLVEGDKMKFSFNGYKTATKYGQRVIPVDDELADTFGKYFSHIGENDFLFFAGSKDGEYEDGTTIEKIQEKQRNNLSVQVKRFLKKRGINASATDITKLLITEIWDSGTTEDKIKFAMWRGHEPTTAAKVYATQL